jgi:hypothetical protein
MKESTIKMAKQITLFLVLILLISCRQEKQSDIYLELNNKTLESEILKYTKFTAENNKNQPFVIRVLCLEINDSTTRYIIGSEVEPSDFKSTPYHFVCEVGGQEVFFTMLSGVSIYNCEKGNFFKLKESSYLKFMKKHFPKDYKLYVEKKKKGYYILNEPEMYYLTFINENLVEKRISMGMHYWSKKF